MTLLIPYQESQGKLYARGRATRELGTPDPPDPVDDFPERYVDGDNEPWKLNAGQHHADDIPAGMKQVNIWDYSTSSDLDVAMSAVERAENVPVAVHCKGLPYYINRFKVYSDGSYRGWANGQGVGGAKRVQVIVGEDRTYDGLGNVVTETQFRMNPDAAKNSDNYVRDGSTYTFPEAGFRFAKYGTGIYMSGSGQSAPTRLLGITMDGALMGPFSTFASNLQTYFQRNAGASGPVPWMGMSLWSMQPGSFMRWMRWRGFSYGLTAAPPFEVGNGSSNRSHLKVLDSESDGRIPGYLDSNRPRSGGAWMANKEESLHFENFWQRYARTSGNAYNVNYPQPNVLLYYKNLQQEHVADGLDGFPMYVAGSDGLSGFSAFQFEEFTGSVEIIDSYVDTIRSHINWPLPGTRADTGEPNVLPSGRPFLTARRLRTGTRQYNNGALRVGTGRQPASGRGTSPIWQHITNLGAVGAKDYFHIYKEDAEGQSTDVLKDFVFSRNYQAAIHRPEDYCVLVSF